MMKRVLIICYYWPPAGGPGVQRWLKFVKYLRDFDIDPVVFIPKNAHYPLRDDSFNTEIPDDITILEFPIREPYRFAQWFAKRKTQQISSGIVTEKNPTFLEKLLLFIRGNLFIPDARVGWVKPATKFLAKYLFEEQIDTIITTGPPHSLHLIGLGLKKRLDLHWIADFRDPWTTIHYHTSLRLTKASAYKHKKMEAEVLNTADTVVVTSDLTKKEFSHITSKPIEVITNGYDTIQHKNRVALDSKFTLVHIGSLLSSRNPKVLWEVISELKAEHQDFKTLFQLKLVGAVGVEIIKTLEEYHLTSNTNSLGYVSHGKALQLQQAAQVLLLIEMNRKETKAIIPGKLFEYLRAKRPILAIVPEGSAIEPIVAETQSGAFFGYEDKQAIKEYLLTCFEKFKQKQLHLESKHIEKYSRKALTKRLSHLIK